MKKIIQTSIVSLALCLLTACAFAQKKTPVANKKNKQPALKTNSLSKEEILGQQVFDVLKANDLAAWHKLYPTYEEYAGMLDQMLAAKMDNITPQKVAEDKAGYKKESDEVFRKDALKLLYQAAALKIEWKDASFNKFDYVTSYPNDLPCRYMKGRLYFYYSQSVYIIEDVEALEVGDTFKLQAVKGITIQSRQQ
jgi:hypothetical protein